MKIVVFHGAGNIPLHNLKKSSCRHNFDAIGRWTVTATYGGALHFVRGTVPGMREGTVPGHEAEPRRLRRFWNAPA